MNPLPTSARCGRAREGRRASGHHIDHGHPIHNEFTSEPYGRAPGAVKTYSGNLFSPFSWHYIPGFRRPRTGGERTHAAPLPVRPPVVSRYSRFILDIYGQDRILSVLGMRPDTEGDRAMTTTDEAKTIRTALKAKGWSSRKVSVRANYFSMGSEIIVTIKDASVPMSVVKEIAKAAEKIDRCEITGEILGGGNLYVDVNYTRKALAAVAAPFVSKIRATFAAIPSNDASSCLDVAPGCSINRAHKGIDSFQLRMSDRGVLLYGTHEAAFVEAAAAVAQFVNESLN